MLLVDVGNKVSVLNGDFRFRIKTVVEVKTLKIRLLLRTVTDEAGIELRYIYTNSENPFLAIPCSAG